MSRIAKQAITLPKGVTATISADSVTVKGAKGSMSLNLRPGVAVVQEGEDLPRMMKGPMTVTGFIAYAQGWAPKEQRWSLRTRTGRVIMLRCEALR
jgi:hypothetical protein